MSVTFLPLPKKNTIIFNTNNTTYSINLLKLEKYT